MMIISFRYIMKTSWKLHTQKKENYVSNKKRELWFQKNILLSKRERLAYERLNVNNSSMIKIEKTMNSSDSR